MFACLHATGNLPALLECAHQFSPLIEATSDDIVVFDIRGLGALHGSPAKIAREIERSIGIGIPASIALSSNPDTAVHAARGFTGTTIIADGKESEKLAPLPLNLLNGSPEVAELFDLWGIRTFGELAKLPPLGVAARLGEEGVYLQRLARGEGYRRLRLINETLRFEEELELEDPIDTLEPLAFLIARLLGDICRQLLQQSLATNEIRLRLTLENAPDHLVTLRLPVPILHKQSFLKILQLKLSDQPPVAAVLKIHLAAEPANPRVTQHGLFVPASPEPEKIELILARIEHIVGKGNVGTPELSDTHRPDSFVMRPFTASANTKNAPAQLSASNCLTLRRFRPVQEAHVTVADRQPTHISAVDAKGKIIRAKGPWRTSGEWWRNDLWNRSEWDIALHSGILYRIFQNLDTDRWFLEGSYD
jgi:protein ImuB